MAPDLAVRPCPRCGASARPDAPWCTQCYLDLRAPASGAAAPRAYAAPPAAAAPRGSAGPASWPCACGAGNALSEDVCTSCGLGFLAGLRAADAPELVLPLVGDLSRFGRTQRTGAAVGLVLLTVVLAALLAVLSA